MKNFESLFAAYMAFWMIFFIYYATVGWRLRRAQDDLDRLKRLLNHNS